MLSTRFGFDRLIHAESSRGGWQGYDGNGWVTVNVNGACYNLCNFRFAAKILQLEQHLLKAFRHYDLEVRH